MSFINDNDYKIVAYREFYDIPRSFVIQTQPDVLLLFDCPFDDDLDDYGSVFNIYTVRKFGVIDLPVDWSMIVPTSSTPIARLPSSRIIFDDTRRASVSIPGLFDLISVR